MAAVRAALSERASVAPVHPLSRATCSALSRSAGEPLAGTAPATRAWLAIEQPGGWGRDALRESRLAVEVSDELTARCLAAGVRPLLVRPFNPCDGAGARRWFAIDASRGTGEAGCFDDSAELLELDLAAFGRGEGIGLGTPLSERQFLVCTNGRRDRCCATLGRPTAEALARRWKRRVWQCSHLGGHRFAANLLVVPDGFLFGRLDGNAAVAVTESLEGGVLQLGHLRGRCGCSAAAQAAEILVRRELGLTASHALAPSGIVGDEVILRVDDGRSVRAAVEAVALGEAVASCEGDKHETSYAWRLANLAVS